MGGMGVIMKGSTSEGEKKMFDKIESRISETGFVYGFMRIGNIEYVWHFESGNSMVLQFTVDADFWSKMF